MKHPNNRYLAILLIGIIAFFTNSSYAQEEPEYHPYLDKSFLIISSSKDFKSAEKVAKQAQKKLELEYQTKSYYPDKKEGFKTDEVCNCGEIHSYFPRGSHDDGNYISVEFSSAYEGFSKGYYIVIVASGPKKTVQTELAKVKEIYPQAYIKNSEIYVGCLH